MRKNYSSSLFKSLHPYVIVILLYKKYSCVVFQEERSNSLTIGVADDHVGLVVGRGGKNIMDISQVCCCLTVLHGIM